MPAEAVTLPARTAVPVQARSIALNGRTIAYTVRRSPRARQVRLRVGAALGVEVVVPARGRLPDVPAILREKADWVLRALDRIAAAPVPARAPLATGATLPYRGVQHRLIVRDGSGIRPEVARDEGARTITVAHDPADYDLAAVLDWWYRQQAREALTARAEHFAAALGVRYGRLTVRDGRSRWGSCSTQGNLNFSWRLLLAPPAVLDYVVIHELAHLREMNHSPQFWAIVAEHCPDYRERQAWLRRHGAELLAALPRE